PDLLITSQLLYQLSYASVDKFMTVAQLFRVFNGCEGKKIARKNQIPIFAPCRCRTTSYSATPAATEMFKDAIFPNIGIRTNMSQCSRTSRLNPRCSPPKTKATGPL